MLVYPTRGSVIPSRLRRGWTCYQQFRNDVEEELFIEIANIIPF